MQELRFSRHATLCILYNMFIGKYKREVSVQTIYTATLCLHTSVAQWTTTNATSKISAATLLGTIM